jgi:putative PIN family toxin of toxin-antitoxin system
MILTLRTVSLGRLEWRAGGNALGRGTEAQKQFQPLVDAGELARRQLAEDAADAALVDRLEAGVLVSGVLNPHGPPGRIVDAILAETVTVLYDDRILNEYRAVFARPMFKFRPSERETLLGFVEVAGESIVAQSLTVVLFDPTDLPFLEVAAAGRADALVTGNARHFKPRRGSHDVDICTPVTLLERLRTR